MITDMNKSRKRSVGFEIFKSNFQLMSIVAFVLISIFAVIVHNMLLSSIETETSLLLGSANTALDYVIKENISLAMNISESGELKQLLRDFSKKTEIEQFHAESEVSSILEKFYQGNTAVSNYIIYLDGKKLLTHVNTPLQPLSVLRNDSFYESHLSLNVSLITDYALTPVNSSSAMRDNEKFTILIKMSDYNKVVLGYLAVSLSKQSLFHNQIINHIPRNGVYVVDNNGLIFLSESNDELGSVADFVKNTTTLDKDTAGKTPARLNNQPSTLFYSSSNSQGWKVIQITPNSELYSWRILFIIIYIVILFVMLVISLIIAKKISPKMVSPITTLASAMEKSVRVQTDNIHYDEFMILYNKYNELLENHTKLLQETEEKNALQKQAELKALIAQINPHFLFNTLNSIGWHALDADQPEICSMLSKLGKLCKNSYNISSMLTTINDEILNVNLYMDLQRECFHNKFTYEINIDPDLTDCIIPKFILQPIVENSIIHGFTQIHHDGIIKIQIYKNTDVIIKISDNGIGIDPDIVEKLNSHDYKSEKFGIYNVNQRITELYGENYGISFASNGSSSTVVTTILPYIKETD